MNNEENTSLGSVLVLVSELHYEGSNICGVYADTPEGMERAEAYVKSAHTGTFKRSAGCECKDRPRVWCGKSQDYYLERWPVMTYERGNISPLSS